MRKVVVLLFCALLISMTACTSNDSSTSEYKRSNEKGKIIVVSLAEMEQMMTNKENFAIYFGTTYCTYCQSFHEILEQYIQDHHVVMYQVILDNEKTTEQENLDIILKYFKEFNTTPGIFYVEDGNEKSYLDTYHLGIDEEVFDEWVQENQIDKK